MKIAVLKERAPGEQRVAASPEIVKKLCELGAKVDIETGAGEGSYIPDNAFTEAGATVYPNMKPALGEADIVLMVQSFPELNELKSGAIVVGFLDPFKNAAKIKEYAAKNIHCVAMEFIPRTSRAQGMDALSSQSNLAGYKAAVDAVASFSKVVPMMMTAAGTVAPARALVLGAGVAGLQAIATLKRLGAIVSAFDVRPAVKEQVQSLGATFVEVESQETASAETKGGYAKEMSEDYKKRQEAKIHETIRKQDIVISTALIPGKPAPVLITEDMVKDMKPGSVIVDLAVASGGNCPLSKVGQTIDMYGVTIVGHENMPSRVAVDASRLYAKNLLHFVTLLIDKENKKIVVNLEDDIIKGALLTYQGEVVHPALKGNT